MALSSSSFEHVHVSEHARMVDVHVRVLVEVLRIRVGVHGESLAISRDGRVLAFTSMVFFVHGERVKSLGQ